MIPKDEIVSRFAAGEPESSIAVVAECSREYIRQILVRALGRDQKQRIVRENWAARNAVTAEKRHTEKFTATLKCAVCWAEFKAIGGGNKAKATDATCSGRCRKLWLLARLYLSQKQAKQHRLSMAKWFIANPATATVSQIRWAKRLLGLPLEPYRSAGSAAIVAANNAGKPWEHAARKLHKTSAAWAAYQEALRLRAANTPPDAILQASKGPSPGDKGGANE